MINDTKQFAQRVTQENERLKKSLKATQQFLQWVQEAKDFSNLSDSELEEWQGVYTSGLK